MLNIGMYCDPNYRVNPVYMEYAKKYKNACNTFTSLDKKIKRAQKPKEADFDNRHRAEIVMKKYESLCQTVSKVLKGGNTTKEQATSEAGSLHKIDYLC